MAISKAMRAALKALSYSTDEFDIRNNYKLERQLKAVVGRPVLFYKPWDHFVQLEGREIPVRMFAPATKGIHEVLLFFHGGGWVSGNIDSYTRVCCTLARMTNKLVISVDYRLAPEHPFPAALEDCYAIAREIFLDPSLLGITADQITLIGDSAGGNLAAAVSLMARDRGEFSPKRQILIYPATNNDHSENSPFESVRTNGEDYLLTSKKICEYMNLYQGSEADRQNPYFAPLLAEDFSNQPRTMILTAEYDPLRDEGEAYADRLRAAGNYVEMHRIPDALHGFFSLPSRFASVRMAYGYINQFLRAPSMVTRPDDIRNVQSQEVDGD